MTMEKIHVGIIGGGIGGLCLAQGLKKAGISVAVYERDETPSSRLQGVRIHINPQGSTALQECLPEQLWKVFDATGGDFSKGFTFVTEQLQELLSMRDDGGPVAPVARHRSISRITLRQILLAGLQGTVHFNKRFTRYEEMPHGRFKVHFEDGNAVMADVLVGADGVNSGVRKQYLPKVEPVDTGVLAVGGKIPLTDGVMALAPHRLLDGPVMVMPPTPCSLFMAMWRRSAEALEALRELGIYETAPEDENYLILGLGGRPHALGLPEEEDAMTGSILRDAMRRAADGWHPNLRKLVELLDERDITVTRLRTSERPVPWKTTRVTLLGDAIHSMTPYRGIGANTALRDAALLCSKLVEAEQNGKPLMQALAEYEASMREYGFAAVEASLKTMRQAVGQKTNPGFTMAKTAMRVVNAVPVLKRKLIPA
jgi:2-polyprenyl-6-methoxyphenol hydroxylase-like FAD-dependent oxidoreductase